MLSKTPSYLCRQGMNWYFRYAIPKELRPIIGRTEIKYSLSTNQLRPARFRAMEYATKTNKFLNEIHTMEHLGPEKIQSLLREYYENSLETLENIRAQHGRVDGSFLRDHAKNLEAVKRLVQTALANDSTDFIQSDIDDFLLKKDIKIDKDSIGYQKFSRRASAVFAKSLGIEGKRLSGDYSYDLAFLDTPVSHVVESDKEKKEAVKLSTAISKYIKVKTESKVWSRSSQKDIPPQLHQFHEIVGDISIDKLDRDALRTYYKVTLALPSRLHVKPYKGKSIKAIIKMKIPDERKLSPKTLETRFTNIKSFINWTEQEGFISNARHLNAILVLPKDMKPQKGSPRAAFTHDELRMIFQHPAYLGTRKSNPSRFWVPLLALFTGARLEELCQLEVNDIREIEGIWSIDINDEGDDKSVKTARGRRKVPLHPFIIESGFLEYVKTVKDKNKEKLFPELKKRKSDGKFSGAVSQWFTRFRRTAGIPDSDTEGKTKAFHSFRHTFITTCKFLRLDRSMYKQVAGHEDGDMDDVTSIYEGEFPITVLMNELISKLDFPDKASLTHLLKRT